MKRMLFIAVCLLSLLAFAGCSTQQEPGVLSVRNQVTGEVISLGDTRASVEKITGRDAATIMEDTLYQVERVTYHDRPGIELGYKDNRVISIHLTQYDAAWEIGGIHPNMEKAEAEQVIAGNSLRQAGKDGGVLLGYDEAGEPVPCSADDPYATPYTVRIGYSPLQDADGNEIPDRQAVGIIAVQNTAPYRQEQ